MKASYGELKQEIDQMKKRITVLEKAYDAIATPRDLQAIEDGRNKVKQGKTIPLDGVKNSVEV